jgi:hypothetical protein
MKLIDRIALNRAIQIILNFILAILKVFAKSTPEQKPNTPKPNKRPLKDLLDKTLPWRQK